MKEQVTFVANWAHRRKVALHVDGRIELVGKGAILAWYQTSSIYSRGIGWQVALDDLRWTTTSFGRSGLTLRVGPVLCKAGLVPPWGIQCILQGMVFALR